MAIPLVLLAALPYKVFSSQAWLDRADDAFARGDCAAASDDARSSLSRRSAPAQSPTSCSATARSGAATRGRRSTTCKRRSTATPTTGTSITGWRWRAGPRASTRVPRFGRAHDLNPLDVLTEDAVTRFATDRPELWKRRAKS